MHQLVKIRSTQPLVISWLLIMSILIQVDRILDGYW